MREVIVDRSTDAMMDASYCQPCGHTSVWKSNVSCFELHPSSIPTTGQNEKPLRVAVSTLSIQFLCLVIISTPLGLGHVLTFIGSVT